MKSSIIAIMLFIVYHAHAMEIVKQDPSVPCDDICYLNQMPSDILDYITRFLTYDDETEEEFIARTQIIDKKEIPEDCCDFVVNYHGSALIAFCPDKTKALFFIRKNGGKVDNIIIIDRQKNDDNDKVMYQEGLDDMDKYRSNALSRSGNMIAMVYDKRMCHFDEEYGEHVYDFFIIQNMRTLAKREMYIPSKLPYNNIAFNKQGTHLIAHANCPRTQNKIYNIISLKTIHADQPQVIVPITNKLQVYLKDKFVCDKYIEGKK